MKLPLYQIDAFTNRVFGGNPAAVVVLDQWLSDEVMQAIAAENNLAETAFVIPHRETSPLRWFTPKVEVDLCGHATLATGHVLFGEIFRDTERLDFDTRSGKVSVIRRDGMLWLDFPSWTTDRIEIEDRLVSALGARPRLAFQNRDLLAVFDTEQDIRDLAPNFALLAELKTLGIVATAPGEECDFVSRFFAPAAGIPEDPVTGSAHCTLAPYWASRLGKSILHARQISERGGDLHCEVAGARTLIGGNTVEYLRGEIRLP